MKELLPVILCLTITLAGCAGQPEDYGVFLGIGGEEAYKLDKYSIVVIEPAEFSSEQIDRLHEEGKTVYGYLNIGAIEEYRPYYHRFRDLSLGSYEDWPDERWVDVSSPAWQRFVVGELGESCARLGLDGLFLDNADVYYRYPAEDIFQGLCAILEGLRGYGLPLVLNGGDSFVTGCMDRGIAPALFDGINQESVFTRIDFGSQGYCVQEESETRYFQEYLLRAKAQGLTVWLLEYGADRALSARIDAWCSEHGFLWYNAKDLALR